MNWYTIAFTNEQHRPLMFYADVATASNIYGVLDKVINGSLAVWCYMASGNGTTQGMSWQPIYGL